MKLPAPWICNVVFASCGARIEGAGPTRSAIVHAYPVTLRSFEAMLSAPLKVSVEPMRAVPLVCMIASGACAARTAATVFNIPAPQVCEVHAHSAPAPLVVALGDTHCGTGALVGNGVELFCNKVMSCAGLSFAFTECMRAAAAETWGAEKLVPTLDCIESV